MTDQFCYVPTGERRQPRKGECFEYGGIIYTAHHDFLEDREPIYRRVPFAVVLGLVDVVENLRRLSVDDSPMTEDEFKAVIDKALAAASDVGITRKESE